MSKNRSRRELATLERVGLAMEALDGCRATRTFALTRNMLAELVEDDDLPGPGGVATVLIDLLTALHHYADTCPVDWDEIVENAKWHHRIEWGIGRRWSLPPYALARWLEWGFPCTVGPQGPIIAIPQTRCAVEMIVELGGTELLV